MRNIQNVLMFMACLFFVASTTAGQKAKNAITNADVVEMVKAGLPENTIVLAIQQSEPTFDTSAKALIELSKQGVSQKILDAMLQPNATKSLLRTKTDDIDAIASKDIGSLRVVLKSVERMKLGGSYGGNGIRCSFEFTNLETQKSIFIAMNATTPDSSIQIGSFLRSTLVDENGGLWRLRSSQTTGVSIVGVGHQNDQFVQYDPTEIVTVLSRRDEHNSDFGKTTYENGEIREYRFIYGSMTEMGPGQSLKVTMSFVQVTEQTKTDAPPKLFQMASEIVLGVLKSGSSKSYSLYNLMFDRVGPTVEGGNSKTTDIRVPSTTAGISSEVTMPGTIRKNSIGMELLYIPPGKFMMGSMIGESQEKPVQTVTISKGFWMGKYEVTQGQWKQVMSTTLQQLREKQMFGARGAYGEGEDYPMYSVSWEDAKEFVRRMNLKADGFEYSLPSEAQWEYAARAGTTGARYGNLDLIAWYNDNSDDTTHPVGTKKPNAFGLFDMLGNVWEWCEDRYGDYSDAEVTDPIGASKGEDRVQRGGAFGSRGDVYFGAYDPNGSEIRSAFRRGYYSPSKRLDDFGFRVVARPAHMKSRPVILPLVR